jgi:hypothetical protein
MKLELGCFIWGLGLAQVRGFLRSAVPTAPRALQLRPHNARSCDIKIQRDGRLWGAPEGPSGGSPSPLDNFMGYQGEDHPETEQEFGDQQAEIEYFADDEVLERYRQERQIINDLVSGPDTVVLQTGSMRLRKAVLMHESSGSLSKAVSSLVGLHR